MKKSLIQFFNYDRVRCYCSFKQKDIILFLRSIFDCYGKQIHFIHFTFMTDEELLVVNQTYLNHDTYTDVITFSLSSFCIESDVFISYEMMRYNADKYKVSCEEELLRLLIHGCLHLCDFNDKSEEEKKLMREKENYWMSCFYKFVSRGTE